MKFRDAFIVLLVIFSGYFAYKSYGYKTQCEIRKNPFLIPTSPQKGETKYNRGSEGFPELSPYFCSDENIGAINFLLNSVDNPFNKARAVVALKDHGCFYNYPTLVSSAREVVNEETRIVKLVNKTDSVSVEMFKDYEKDYESVSKYFENPMEVVARFNEELDKRATKELGQLFGREKL